MEGFRPRQRGEAKTREGAAAAGILDPGPGEGGVEVVAAIHEPGTGRDTVADRDGGVLVGRPYRGGETVFAVIHQAYRLVVRGDLHDADDGSETLLAHHPHRMVDADQHLRREIGR